MEKLSVLLPTFNSQELIRDCLEAFRWADEILVVDSFSTDQTLDICKEYGARIIQHEYVNSAKQKNWAIPQCAHEWVLQVDTDERLEEGAREEIEAVLRDPSPDVDGYRFPFKHHILGEWIRVAGLYPEYHLRLFRKATGRFQDREVHAHVQVPGRVETMSHHFLHYGMPTLSKQLANLDRYSRYEADELAKRGRGAGAFDLVARPWIAFFYRFILQRGFTAGFRGFVISIHAAISVFYANAKLWEKQLPRDP